MGMEKIGHYMGLDLSKPTSSRNSPMPIPLIMRKPNL